MKLLKYVVCHDFGVAPNPFGRFCTLALCTPNHMSAKLNQGDWILGHSTKDTGHKIIYLMELLENPFGKNDYFNDSRFEYKKPSKRNIESLCGDNMYEFRNGKWENKGIDYHTDEYSIIQDTRRDKVFVSENFTYFGGEGFSLAKSYPEFIARRGIQYITDKKRIDELIKDVKKIGFGKLADPRDFKNHKKKKIC